MPEGKVRGDVPSGEAGRFVDKYNDNDTIEALETASPEPLTNKEVAKRVGYSKPTAHNRLHELADDGVVLTKKVGAKARVWWVDAETPSPEVQETVTDAIAHPTRRELAQALLNAHPEPLTNKELADQAGCSKSTVQHYRDELADEAHVFTKKAGAKARVWWVDPEAEE